MPALNMMPAKSPSPAKAQVMKKRDGHPKRAIKAITENLQQEILPSNLTMAG
jgi:hypothetical protein